MNEHTSDKGNIFIHNTDFQFPKELKMNYRKLINKVTGGTNAS